MCKCRPIARHADAPGFTLVEMLVAVAMLSILAGAVYMNVSQSVAAWRKAEAVRGGSMRLAAVLAVMAKELRCAYVPPDCETAVFKAGGGEKGEGRQISFITLYNRLRYPGRTVAPAVRIEYRFEPAPEGESRLGRLLRTETPVVGVAPIGEPETRIMLDNVSAVRMECMFEGNWSDFWVSSSALPERVRISVTVEADGSETTFVTNAALRVNTGRCEPKGGDS